MALGSIVIDLLMRTGAFENDAKKAERRFKELGKQARAAGAVIGGALATGIVATTAAIHGLIQESREIQRLSTVANVAAADFQKLALGAQTVGIEQEKLADIYKDTQDKLGDFLQNGGGPLKDFFDNIAPAIGVTADQFAKLGGADALQLYVNSLDKANLSQSEMTFYMEAIASDSALLLPLLRNNAAGFQEWARFAEEAGAVMDEQTIRATNELNDSVQKMKISMDGAWKQALPGLIPKLQDLASLLNSESFRSGFGAIINGAVQATGVLANMATTVANVTKFLAEEVAARVAGPAVDDIVRIEDRISRLRKTIDAVQNARGWNPFPILGASELVPGDVLSRPETIVARLQGELEKEQNKLKIGLELQDDAVARAQALANQAVQSIDVPTINLSGRGASTKDKAGKDKAPRDDLSILQDFDRQMMLNEQRALEYTGRLEDLRAEMAGPAAQAMLNYQRALGELDAAKKTGLLTTEQAIEMEGLLAEQYHKNLDELKDKTDSMSVMSEQAARNMQDAFADFLFDPFESGIDGMLKGFADILRRMAAEAAAARIFEALGQYGQKNSGSWWGSLLGAFGGTKKAAGGYIAGPGTSTSDSIPALLSNGEYVIKASAVSQYGRGFFDRLNAKRFASGGLVGGGSPAPAFGAQSVNVNIHNAPAGTTAQAKQGPNGLNIDVIIGQIERAIGGNIAQGSGPAYSAVKSRFQLRDAI